VIIVEVARIDRLGAVTHKDAAGGRVADHLQHRQLVTHGGRQFGPCPAARGSGAGGPLCRLCAQLRQQGRHHRARIGAQGQGGGVPGQLCCAQIDPDHA